MVPDASESMRERRDFPDAWSDGYDAADATDPGYDGWLSQRLGWLSMALGLGALAAPRAVAQLTGLNGRHGLIRTVGAREMASGIGLLTMTAKTPWLWARVIGDAMDLAVLGLASGRGRARQRAVVSAVVVAAIAAADVFAAYRASRLEAED